MRGTKIAVVAILAGVVLTPRLMPGHPLVESVERFVDRTWDRVAERFSDSDAYAMAEVEMEVTTRSSNADAFEWSGFVDEGRVVEVRGVNGEIEAVPARGDEVVIVAEKTARRSDPGDVRIEVIEHDEGVTVCAVYPSRGARENRCGPGDEYRSNVQNNDVSVEFTIQVPEGVRLDVQTVNGDVEATELSADVDARTVNGDIEVSTLGFARAATVNGSIEARMGRWMPEGARFETVNGSIDLDLPDDVNADLDAQWVNGGLDSDLPFTVDGRITKRSAQGRLGDGGPDLEVKTVNGSIRIR